MAEEEKSEKKIIVDEDWKTEVKKDKENLTTKEETEQQPQEQQAPASQAFPEGDFAALVSMLATQALYALGMLQLEEQKKEPDLNLAKYNIGMLDTLEQRTKGNLTEQEQVILSNTLSQVRMAYVNISG